MASLHDLVAGLCWMGVRPTFGEKDDCQVKVAPRRVPTSVGSVNAAILADLRQVAR
jgi:hypothetical protein